LTNVRGEVWAPKVMFCCVATAVTVTACVPDEQAVALEVLHMRT